MDYDNVCKLLCKQFPQQYASWMVKGISAPVRVLEQELSLEPIRADSVIFLQTQDRILHVEFHVNVESSQPPIPLRMLDHWVRLHRKYRLPVVQGIVLLKDSPAARSLPNEFRFDQTVHPFHIVRLWEMNVDWLLQDTALYPLAVLTKTGDPEQLLNRVAETIKTIDNKDERTLISGCAQILAGLRYDAALIHQTFKEDIMRESVIYQEILQEGRQEGRQEGQQLGLAIAITRQMQRKFGNIEPSLLEQIQQLSITALEELAVMILDCNEISEIEIWLEHKQV